jgi:hypothetical protein
LKIPNSQRWFLLAKREGSIYSRSILTVDTITTRNIVNRFHLFHIVSQMLTNLLGWTTKYLCLIS